MKILLDCRLMTAKPTGISRYSEKLVSYYIDRFGVDKIIILLNEPRPDLKYQQIITNLKPFNIIHWMIFPLWLKNKGINYYISFHYSGLAYKLTGVKSAITVHDMMFELVPSFFSGVIKKSIGKYYFRTIVKRSMYCSDLILSVSETTKNDVLSLYEFDSLVTGEGLFLDASPDNSILKKLDLHDKEYYLYIGNDRPHKNIKNLIKSFLLTKEKYPKRLLVLVGHHSSLNTEGIIYPGYVNDEQLVSLYQNALTFVFPSLYEGFGLPIMEALSNRCTVIASDIPAFREFSNNNIVYFDLSKKDSLKNTMLLDIVFDDKQAEMILDKFSWKKTFQNLDQILRGFI